MPLMDDIRALKVDERIGRAVVVRTERIHLQITRRHDGCRRSVSDRQLQRPVPGMDMIRKVPVLLSPEDVQVDVFLSTHNHQDHTDPETIRRSSEQGHDAVRGSAPEFAVYAREGIESGRITPTWPDVELEFQI